MNPTPLTKNYGVGGGYLVGLGRGRWTEDELMFYVEMGLWRLEWWANWGVE